MGGVVWRAMMIISMAIFGCGICCGRVFEDLAPVVCGAHFLSRISPAYIHNMGWFDNSDHEDAYNTVCFLSSKVLSGLLGAHRVPQVAGATEEHHKASLSHEVLGGAAAFAVNSCIRCDKVNHC